MGKTEADRPAHEPYAETAPYVRPRHNRIWRLIWGSVCLVAALFAAGFGWFVLQVQMAEPSVNSTADGVVVLTGGPERIADAIDLVATGRGKRLLITGVNPMTRMAELSRLTPRSRTTFNCCVDIDRAATNTIGNAIETRRWARSRNFNSLIVVTSDYHMPRAMAELTHQLPNVNLIAYPVVTERQRNDPWWTHAVTSRTMAIEYMKLVAALLRMQLEADPPANEVAAVRVGTKD
ncbi:MAG TPA: YdcF family protein [Xanthobacteraceae bacterium]|nr:YdcF family protein [Xanthobacteraceae bacterium]